MRKLNSWIVFSSLIVGSVACGTDEPPDDGPGSAAKPSGPRRVIEQVAPPIEIKEPPDDATKTASGLVYKKLAANDRGARAGGRDTTLVHYTGWRQRTGETFFSTKGRGQPIAVDVAHAAPGFSEALQLLHKGEKAVLWVPPGQGTPEALVYEVEVVDVVSAVAARTEGKVGDRTPGPAPPAAASSAAKADDASADDRARSAAKADQAVAGDRAQAATSSSKAADDHGSQGSKSAAKADPAVTDRAQAATSAAKGEHDRGSQGSKSAAKAEEATANDRQGAKSTVKVDQAVRRSH